MRAGDPDRAAGFLEKFKTLRESPLGESIELPQYNHCLLYTSDAADERSSVDLGGRRIIKKKTNVAHSRRCWDKEQKKREREKTSISAIVEKQLT